MARHLRVEFPGAIYHVSCRMVGDWRKGRERLFVDDADHERFLERLSERVETYGIRLCLFVCMTNHFHLVFETPRGNLAKFMQSLSTAYTVYYNLRHERHGHLLDGRYKARLVEGDAYLLRLSRYVHLNPVQVGALKDRPIEDRVAALRTYPWSSYRSYIDKRRRLEFLTCGPVLGQMGGKAREQPGHYRQFVETGLAESDEEFKAVLRESPRSIGGDGFRAWVDDRYLKRVEAGRRPEDASFRHPTELLSADDVLRVVGEEFAVEPQALERRRRGSPLRAVAARLLTRYAGLSQRDVAERLRIGSGSAVCKQLRGLPERLAADRGLRRRLEAAAQRLRAAQRSSPGSP